MIIAELRSWNGENKFGANTEKYFLTFENMKEVKRFLKEKNHPLVLELFGEDYNEEIIGLIYVCRTYEECIGREEKIYNDYIDRIFNNI